MYGPFAPKPPDYAAVRHLPVIRLPQKLQLPNAEQLGYWETFMYRRSTRHTEVLG